MRLLAKLFASLLIVLVVALSAYIAVLHTSYGLPLVKRTFSTFTSTQLDAKSLSYSITRPFSVALLSPEFRRDEYVLKVANIDVTVAPLSFLTDSPTLQQLLVSGLTLDNTTSAWLPHHFSVEHLALESLQYQSEQLTLSDADMQVSDWSYQGEGWGTIDGRLQLAAPKLRWEGIQTENLLLDSEKREDDWEVWGLSFDSALANVTASATLQPNNHVVFQQLTVSDSQLEASDALSYFLSQLETYKQRYTVDIQRLDMLDISAELSDMSVDHLTLSAQSIRLKNGKLYWQETSPATLLSFNANLLRIKDWVFTDAIADLSLSQRAMDINALSAKLEEGFVSVAGSLTQDSLHLNNLILNGLDFDIQNDVQQVASLWWQSLDDVTIDNLAIRHLNLTAPVHAFPFQLQGMNIKGQDLSLKKAGKTGLWSGTLTTDASAASINRIFVSAPFLRMSVTENVWSLDAASLTFKEGQLTANANVDLGQESRKWALSVSGLGVPTEIYQYWFDIALPLRGKHDITAEFSGIGATKDSLYFSLTGMLEATPNNTFITLNAQQNLRQSLQQLFADQESGQTEMPLSVSKVKIAADRGRIRLSALTAASGSESYTVSGQWDLATQQGALSVD